MRFNLDKAEKLIGRIRAAEANLARLYEEWESLAVSSKSSASRPPVRAVRGGRKLQSNSLTGRIVAHLEKFPDAKFTHEEVATALSESDSAAVRRSLDKQVFNGRIERRGRGEYGAKIKEAPIAEAS